MDGFRKAFWIVICWKFFLLVLNLLGIMVGVMMPSMTDLIGVWQNPQWLDRFFYLIEAFNIDDF